MTNMITLNNETKTMSSLEIAELTGKRHDHVMEDIRKMLEELELDIPTFRGIYKDSMNRKQSMFNLDKELTLTLVSGYSIKLRNSIIKRWEELEQAIDAIAESKTHEEALSIATLAKQSRELLRVGHTNLTSVIQSNKDTIGGGIWCQSNIQRLASIIVLGDAPKVVKEYEDNPNGLAPRDYMAENAMLEELMAYDRTLAKIETMADLGMSYSDIKNKLTK